MVAIDAKEIARAVGNVSRPCRCCCLGTGGQIISCERYGPVDVGRHKRSSVIRKDENRNDEKKRE